MHLKDKNGRAFSFECLKNIRDAMSLCQDRLRTSTTDTEASCNGKGRVATERGKLQQRRRGKLLRTHVVQSVDDKGEDITCTGWNPDGSASVVRSVLSLNSS